MLMLCVSISTSGLMCLEKRFSLLVKRLKNTLVFPLQRRPCSCPSMHDVVGKIICSKEQITKIPAEICFFFQNSQV